MQGPGICLGEVEGRVLLGGKLGGQRTGARPQAGLGLTPWVDVGGAGGRGSLEGEGAGRERSEGGPRPPKVRAEAEE